jgi:hypothetical protein
MVLAQIKPVLSGVDLMDGFQLAPLIDPSLAPPLSKIALFSGKPPEGASSSGVIPVGTLPAGAFRTSLICIDLRWRLGGARGY